MKKLKTFESFMGSQIEEITQEVEDILQELKDIGFETKARYWIGGRKSYGKTAENIEIYIYREKEYKAKDITDVYERICHHLEQEGFKKDLVARNGYVGSVPHLRVFEFMETWSSRFSFSRI